MKRLLSFFVILLCALPVVVKAQVGPPGFDPRYQTLGSNGAIYQSRAVPNYRYIGRGYYFVTPPNYRYTYPMHTLRGNVIYRSPFDRQNRYRTYSRWGIMTIR